MSSNYQSFGMSLAESNAASILTRSITSDVPFSPTSTGLGLGGQAYWSMPKIPDHGPPVTASTRSLCPDSRLHQRHGTLNLGNMQHRTRSPTELHQSIQRALEPLEGSQRTMATSDDREDRRARFVLGNPEDRFTQLKDPFESALKRAQRRAMGGAQPRTQDDSMERLQQLGYFTSDADRRADKGAQGTVRYGGLATNLQHKIPDHQNYAHQHRFADHGPRRQLPYNDYKESVQYFVSPGHPDAATARLEAARRGAHTRPRDAHRGRQDQRSAQQQAAQNTAHHDYEEHRDFARNYYVEDDYDQCQFVEVDVEKLERNKRSATTHPLLRCLQLCTG